VKAGMVATKGHSVLRLGIMPMSVAVLAQEKGSGLAVLRQLASWLLRSHVVGLMRRMGY